MKNSQQSAVGSRQLAERRSQRQRGITSIELLIAMLLLAIGLVALVSVIYAAVLTNSRNRLDSTATLLAQQVMEQIVAQPAALGRTMTITDCAGNNWTVKTAAGGATLYTSASAPSTAQVNAIDYSQAVGAVPAGYQMSYVNCNANGIQTTYDVRWNVTTLTNVTRSVTVGAKPNTKNNLSVKLYAPPVSLRTVAGQVP